MLTGHDEGGSLNRGQSQTTKMTPTPTGIPMLILYSFIYARIRYASTIAAQRRVCLDILISRYYGEQLDTAMSAGAPDR